ncbi:DUF1697 domain-containing protein [Octadecabacter sp. R77987]|uniref:DUF1697 domain-containing protein n=1 Tax=Octadecabacter sp. R77987 TaxID=3093874 RepID=UPI00367170D8
MSDLDQMYVALLRGVNVGGNNKVSMADLRVLAGGLGWQDVRSYIASGNLVFRAAAPRAADLRAAVVAQMGIDVPVQIVTGDTLRRALNDCPFTPDDPRHVHVFFALGRVDLDDVCLAALSAPREEVRIAPDLVWLFAPDGIGRSKLAAGMEKVMRCPLTARNLRTIQTLVEMLDG